MYIWYIFSNYVSIHRSSTLVQKNLFKRCEKMFKVLFCVLIIGFDIRISFGANETNPMPVVLWHGMGDTSFYSLGGMKSFLQQNLGPNSYVKSIRMGKNSGEDFRNSYFMHANLQVKKACEMISSDPKLKDGYNAIGVSQGSQLL